MGLFDRFKRSNVSNPQYWLTRLLSSGAAKSGAHVSPDSSLRVAAVYACIRVIAETLATLPLVLYERVESGKKPAKDHPLYRTLHDRPNDYQTSFEWREVLAVHLNLRGNSYCLKVPGPRGYVKGLIPLNPANMVIEIKNGEVIYQYTDESGKTTPYGPEEIWHVKNMAISSGYNGAPPEGVVGISPIACAVDVIGLSLAADQYGSTYFANNAVPGLNFKYPGKLSDEAKKYLSESLNEYAKGENKFKNIITEQGGEIKQVGISNTDSQFIESRQFSIEEIARIFRVPPVLIGHPTNTMTYASAEQMFLSFGKFTIQPWCSRIEGSINRHLIPEADQKKYFAEFKLEGLLRADTKTRMDLYASARQWGWMNTDEIRALENMNPLPEEKGTDYWRPANMSIVGEEIENEEPTGIPDGAAPDDGDPEGS